MRKPPPLEVRLRTLGVEPLGPGERSEKVRVRGPEELFQLLEHLSPKQRGEALMAGLKVLGWAKEVKDGEGKEG
ncbi:hypothetical protein FJNA_24270 [Thermus sp. FJN-A]